MRRLAALLLSACALALVACGGGGNDDDPPSSPSTQGSGTPARSAELGEPEVVATGLQVPWGMDWLPDGDVLVAERTTGTILRIPKDGGEPSVAKRLPN